MVRAAATGTARRRPPSRSKGGEEKVYHVVKISFKDKDGKYSHAVTKKDSAYGTVDFGHSY